MYKKRKGNDFFSEVCPLFIFAFLLPFLLVLLIQFYFQGTLNEVGALTIFETFGCGAKMRWEVVGRQDGMGRNLGLNPGEPEYFVRISHLVGNLQSQVVNLIFPDTSARHFFCILIPCSTIKKKLLRHQNQNSLTDFQTLNATVRRSSCLPSV